MSLATTQRLTRAALAATVSTFVALTSHMVGGGNSPAAAGVLVPLALSFAVCVQLAGRALSLWRLTLAVTVSQALFHTLFVLGSGDTALASSGHAHHAGAISVAASQPSFQGAHGGAVMTVAHLAAAVVTIAAMHHAEALLARGGTVLGWLSLARLVPRTSLAVVMRQPHATVASRAGLDRALMDVVVGVHSLRGPPLCIR